MRKFATLSILILLGLLLVSCGTPAATQAPIDEPATEEAPTTAPEVEPTDEATEAAAGEPVTITWLMFYDNVLNDEKWMNELKMFNDTHEDIQVEIIGVGWNDFAPKMQSMIAAGTPPDVVAIQNEGTFVSKGFVVPLEDLIARDNLDLNNFVPGGADPAYDGKIYGFRHDTSYWMLYYNKDIFDEAGVDYPPAEGWTLDEFMETACQLTDSGKGIWGMHNINWLWAFLAAQQGLPYIEMVDGVPQYKLDDPKTMEFIQKLADFINKDKCQPSSDDLSSLGGADAFIAGKTAMQFNGNWAFGGTKDNAEFNYGVAPLPGLKQPNVGMKIGIVSSSEKQDAAWEFVKWLTYEPEASRYRAENGIGQPAITDKEATDIYLSGPATPDGADEVLAVFSDPANGLTVLDQIPGKAEADNIINPIMDEIMNGISQAVDVLPDAVKQANEAMAEVFRKETGQ